MRALARARSVRLAIFDVDGVMTDGTVYLGPRGEAFKAFNILDGHGVKMLHEAGIVTAIISGRRSKAVALRARELDMRHVEQGAKDKVEVFQRLTKRLGVTARALDLEGRVQYTRAARKMVHSPDDDSAHLEAVAIEAFEPRQPKLTLTADRGRLEEGGDRVTIEGNVVIVREGDARTEALRLTTEKLLVLPDAGKASTKSEVTMESPSSRAVAAAGLELDNRARTLRLDQVHATFKPQPR